MRPICVVAQTCSLFFSINNCFKAYFFILFLMDSVISQSGLQAFSYKYPEACEHELSEMHSRIMSSITGLLGMYLFKLLDYGLFSPKCL